MKNKQRLHHYFIIAIAGNFVGSIFIQKITLSSILHIAVKTFT